MNGKSGYDPTIKELMVLALVGLCILGACVSALVVMSNGPY